MNLESFLHELHFDPDKAKPPNLEVDWDDAPLPYKLYRGQPAVALRSEVPLELKARETPARPVLHEIGHLLWMVYGLAQYCQYVFPSGETTQNIRRFVPSGGGLYPGEIYVYLKLEDLPAGVYHYDAAHHRLIRLREGNFDAYLARALGRRCDTSACFGAVFVSVMFWKNFFKYHNFAYRLQGLDAGVLIGQLLEVARRFGFETGVYFQFLDRALHHMLGLAEREESVYAVVALAEAAAAFQGEGGDGPQADEASAELCSWLEPVGHDHFVRSRRISEFPLITAMNEASFLESSRSFRPAGDEGMAGRSGPALALPKVEGFSYDLMSASRRRFSPGPDFVAGGIRMEQLSVLLQEATAAFRCRTDLDGRMLQPIPRVSLYGCLHRVEGIPDGAYRYDSITHSLSPVSPGDHRFRLLLGTPPDNVNLSHVPLCLHVAGDSGHLSRRLGYRGYRIQQMEAGMLAQQLLLVASALGLGGHPLLAFNAKATDEFYRLDGTTSLILIAIGPYRQRPRLGWGLLS